MNSIIAKYGEFSMSRRSIISLSLGLWQIIDLFATDKSRHFAITMFNFCLLVFCFLCCCFFYFPQGVPYFTDLARRLDQSQRELSFMKTGGMLSCTLETNEPSMISTMICIMTQTPSGQMVGIRDPSVLVCNFAALCPTVRVQLPWRFMSLKNEQLACKPTTHACTACSHNRF